MWASQFQPNKQTPSNNQISFLDIVHVIKDILMIANSFFKSAVLTVLIDFLDKLLPEDNRHFRPAC